MGASCLGIDLSQDERLFSTSLVAMDSLTISAILCDEIADFVVQSRRFCQPQGLFSQNT